MVCQAPVRVRRLRGRRPLQLSCSPPSSSSPGSRLTESSPPAMTTGGSNRPRRWRRSPGRSLWIPTSDGRSDTPLWSVPQLGIWIGVMLWLLGGIFGFSSAAAVLGLQLPAPHSTLPPASSSSARRYQRSARPRWILLDRARCGTGRALHACPPQRRRLVPRSIALGLLFRLNRRLSTRQTITY